MKKLSIIIPCFNEEKTLQEILSRVLTLNIPNWEIEVVVVDDASSDHSPEILESYKDKVKVLTLEVNSGKGTAVLKGLDEAVGDFLIIQDADLEYNPAEIPLFIREIEKGEKVVYGSRNLYHRKRKGFIFQRVGVWLITVLINVMYKTKLTDVWTCYKLFPKEIKDLFVPGGFEAELLFTTGLLRKGYRIKEVPISHAPRNEEDGKKIRYRDGLRAIQLIIADRLLNIRKQPIRGRRESLVLICCPYCKGDLEQRENSLICKSHGVFQIDENNRPILIDEAVYKANSIQHESGINWLKSFLKQFPKFYYSIWHVFCPVLMVTNGPRMILDYFSTPSILLDVGSGPERLGNEFINIDIFPFPEVDIVSDATMLPFKDGSIDGAVSESLFEHVPDAYKVAKEMVRAIKPGGYIYISAPFIHPYHASPDDFNRWTMSGLKHLFPTLNIVKSGVRSGPWSAFLMFFAYWLGIIFSFGSKRAAPFLAHVFMLILGPLKYLDLIFMYIPGSEAVSTHLYILGRKPIS